MRRTRQYLTLCGGCVAEDEQPGSPKKRKEYLTPQLPDEELEERIEDILHEDDVDNDGYVDYAEFMLANKRRGGFEAGEKPYSPEMF